MSQDEMLQRIFDKLISLKQGQKNLEQGLENLKIEILMNRQAITEVQTDVKDIKEAMRFL